MSKPTYGEWAKALWIVGEVYLTGWENFYALGYYDRDGKAYLTTWDGDRPIVKKWSIGCPMHKIPLWDEPVPAGARLIAMPSDDFPWEQVDGIVVIGWEMEEPIERKEKGGGPTTAVR